MRSFQILFLLIFILIVVATALGTFQCLKLIISEKLRKAFAFIFWGYNLLLLLFFVFLYIYPYTPREASNYGPYLIFNSVLLTDFIFKIPLSLAVIIHSFLKRKSILFSGVILSFGLGSVLVYGVIFGRNELKVTPVTLNTPELPKEFDNWKIVQISDIHLGSMLGSTYLLKKTKEEIKRIHPDLILFTGDLVNNFASETNGWENLFKELNGTHQSYSILGNHDYGDYTTWQNKNKRQANFEAIVNAHKTLGFQLLRNEHRVLNKGNDSIFIIGVENWGHPPFPQYARLDTALAGIPRNSFKILMTHDPAHWESKVAGKQNIQLTLSGHSHGLQWGIKIAGIPFSFAGLTRKNWGGLYTSGNNFLNVNTGLGTVGVPYRIDMPGELTLITLKAAER